MPALSRFIRYFMAVGRLGSIRRAADELAVSASAIDRQILNAEARLGVQLFERLPTGLRLTAAGEVMMAAGGRWQKQLVDTLSQIEDLRGLKRGHVDIAVIDALAKGYMPAALHAIQQSHPGITIGVQVLGNEQVRRAIAANDVDFGILFDPQSYQDLTVRAFVDVVLGIVSPPGHPLARKAEVRFSECDGQSVILPAAPLAVHQQVAILEATSGVTLHRRVTSDNIQMIASLIQEGDSVGILTSLDVSTEVRAGSLAFTRIADKVLRPMTLALCTATARTPSYAAAMVLREIEAGFTRFAYIPPPVARSQAQSPST